MHMKKKYIIPQMEIFSIKPTNAILATSLTPEPWDGGGGAGSRLFEDDGMDLLMGGGEYSDLEKMLLP